MAPRDEGHDNPPTNGGESPGADSSPEGATMPFDRHVLELEHVFTTLSHSRRRYLLYALAENSEWTLTELATKLIAWEQDIDETAVEEHSRTQAYISLYHTHVPKLVDDGVITFDGDNETIAKGPHAEQTIAALAGAGASLDSAQEAHASRAHGRRAAGRPHR